MQRLRLAHPFRRSLMLALLVAAPLVIGAWTLGANPLPMFVGGTVVALFGALLFGGMLRWLPGLAFTLVLLPSLIAATAVFGWPFAAIVPIVAACTALKLFYRPDPPEPPPRRRPAPRRRDDDERGPGYSSDHGQTWSSSGSGGGFAGAGGGFAGAGASAAWGATSGRDHDTGGDSGGSSDGGGGDGGGG
ncbi:MAG: hypothetical protein ACREUE_08900 [Panacagrimonas sp.]